MPSQDILDKYDDVKLSLEKAIEASDNIELSGDDENAALDLVRETLSELNSDFKSEIDRLEKSGEWEKFCIAFFGETNAGKSTIIEALRIAYDEELRREKINDQSEKYQEELSSEKDQYTELLGKLKKLNDSLEEEKSVKNKEILRGIGLTILGFIAGFLAALLIF